MAMSRMAGQLLFRRFASTTASPSAEDASIKLWSRIFWFVCVPAMTLCGINCYLKEMEHMKHHERPEYVPYEYLGKRAKRYPWGDGNRTLFHNPKVNALPGIGYEE